MSTVEQRRRWNATYRARHPERVKESHARWLEGHRAEHNKRQLERWHSSSDDYNAEDRARYASDPSIRHQQHLRKMHGITLGDYRAMAAAQGGVCAICRQPETMLTPRGDVQALAVDHDHRTGRIRGLLCRTCNQALGGFRDDPAILRAAADYLECP